MEYLKYSPRCLIRYVPFVVNDYSFTCFDHMKPYCNIKDIRAIYMYLNSLEDFQYKNVWNILHRRWVSLKARSTEDIPTFKRTKYHKVETEFIHKNFTDESFDRHMREFMEKDMVKTIFAMDVIISHGHPQR